MCTCVCARGVLTCVCACMCALVCNLASSFIPHHMEGLAGLGVYTVMRIRMCIRQNRIHCTSNVLDHVHTTFESRGRWVIMIAQLGFE